ncbi:S-layer homology domain-containing protein [Paenibacillus sp. GCM10023248]|uniref:S-layer homology domain-containing protein n=1 Tax=unclassified Paenibacillus TaxID=185978 RepID=UPI00237902DF|nr:S-layer homology domain-containing protein [Paenibacillus sp. MAHUQ-63]MDD9267226.1 S-layer homology domain-containing protein [Paenibacillus sp. MAHUQ-63]
MSKHKKWFHAVVACMMLAGFFLSPLSFKLTASAEPAIQLAAAPAAIYPYQQPSKYAASANYKLKANGVEIPVVKAYNDYDYANFSASGGPITYELTILNTAKVTEYAITPKKLGIKADKVEGTTLTFTTSKDEYLIVMMNGRTTKIVIAADPVETDVPASSGDGIYNVTQAPYRVTTTGDKTGVAERTAAIQQAIDDASSYGTARGNGVQGIVYIPAGEYYIGNLVLKSNTALYMQPGAAFIGTGKTADYTEHWFKDSMGRPATWWLSTAFDSNNIKIYGRGTLDGNGAALAADKSTNNKGMINNLVVPIATANFKMDGVLIRESAAWAVMPVRSNDLEFTNLKMFNSLGMGENDGIDIVESQNAVVRNAIGISLDDPFSTKSWKEDTDIASGKVPWPGKPEPVNHILFEDAIAWTACYGFKIGQGVMQDQEDITFRNGVVYKAAVGFAIHHKYGTGAVRNVTFEDMDVEDISGKNEDNSAWMTLFTVNGGDIGVGPIDGVTVRNITVRDAGESFAKIKGQEGAPITGLTFENVYMPGSTTPAKTLHEMNFLDREYQSGVTIKPVQETEPRPRTNYALNQPAVASSNDTSVDTAPLAFDGNLTTRFGSKRGVDPGWVYVDLGESKRINEVQLYWEAAYGTSYQIQVSDDAQNWRDVYSTTSGKGGLEKITFNEANARYVRMYGTKRATQYGYSLWEFQVYGPEVLADSISLNKTSSKMLVGMSEQLTAAILPEDTTNQKIIWSTSNAKVATVNSQGLVTAIGEGTAKITAVTWNGELKATAAVTVTKIGTPQLQSVIAGDGHAIMNWTTVEGATGYKLYASPIRGSYGAEAASVSDAVYSYKVEELTNGTAYYFVVKAVYPAGESSASNEIGATPQIPLPGAPTLASIIPGDGQAQLNWLPVDDATGYVIYQSTASGTYQTETATVSSSVYRYDVRNLTNGTTYYFMVKAMNGSGESPASNEISITPAAPMKAPGAPTAVNAVAQDGRAIITFTAPSDHGGSPITRYEVTSSPGGFTEIGAASPITIPGLINGTSYTFTVKAFNEVGASPDSQISNAVIPSAPDVKDSKDNDSPIAPVNPRNPAPVPVPQKDTELGQEIAANLNGQTITTYVVDAKQLDERLAAEGERARITIPVSAKSDVIVGELDGQMVKNMENQHAVMELKTEKAAYTLPALQFNIDALSKEMGESVALQDIKIRIEIATPTTDTMKFVEDTAANGGFKLVAPPVQFRVKALYGDKTVEITQFNAYVERMIAIPDGIAPDRILTGVVIDPDGNVRHVPTKIVLADGKYYALINSLTNSTYTVIWHPVHYTDIDDHWAKDAVASMGSRMIVTGFEDQQFHPDQEMTRGEFAAILVRALGIQLPNYAGSFSDVGPSDWYSRYIQAAYAYDLIDGYEDGSFRPRDTITREQAMAVIAKAMKITGIGAKPLNENQTEILLQPYMDMKEISEWAVNGVADCLQKEIVVGKSQHSIDPKAFITRAEVVVSIQRLLQKSELIS